MPPTAYPDNPVLVHVERGGVVESVHRGAWVVTDRSGRVVEGAGAFDAPVFARSTIKSLQALPLVESGAAEAFGVTDDELALALASHSGEPCHTERVAATLARLGLSEADLRCGTQPPADRATREELVRAGRAPGALHHNCSGKHAGFLVLARHLGVEPATYLDPASDGQRLVRTAISQMTGVAEPELVPAIDGCSAPTYRLPLGALATAFARVADPDGLESGRAAICRRMRAAVAAHPELVAGSRKRLCTDLVRASGGRLFPKVGAEAVYAIGLGDGDRGLAVKVDDGGWRGLFAAVLALVERLGWLAEDELDRLERWRDPILRNSAGLEVGRIETRLGPRS